MPSSNTGLALLLRKEQLSKEEHLEFVRRRVLRVAARLDDFSTPELGEAFNLMPGRNLRSCTRFKEANQIIAGMDHLQERGLFFAKKGAQFPSGVQHGHKGELGIWGITAKKPRLSVIVYISYEGYSDLGGSHLSIRGIQLVPATITEVHRATGKSPADMLLDLTCAIKTLTEEAQNRYEFAKTIYDEMNLEDEAFKLIGHN